ncbi:MAG: hypothetical protein Q9216_006826 [Gyalolechia sp. 2 TL-2023]
MIMIPLDSNTASKQDSIWKALNESTFRKTIADLGKASGDVPGQSRPYSLSEWERRHTDHNLAQRSLTLEDEQRLADDLACIAASREKGKAVSAVTLEEQCNPPGMIVRLAANASIPNQVPAQLNAIFRVLHARVQRGVHFGLVVELDRQRIHSRLRSKHWKPKGNYQGPVRTEPLHKDLLTLLPALRTDPDTRVNHEKLTSLCATYRNLDRNFADKYEELQLLQDAVKSSAACYLAITTSTSETPAFTSKDKRVLRQNILKSKHVQQVGKIGRYWTLCVFVTKTARRYPDLFKNIRLELLRPYKPVKSTVTPMQPSIDCYVHAEIQLIVFYGLTPNLEGQMPRVLGVSKSACYLCDLFISLHDQYFISATHGRLYDKWTVPNLANFSIAQRQQYRTILQRMLQICKLNAHKKKSSVSRAYPAESALKLHAAPSSIAATTVTNLSQLTIQGPAPSVEPHAFPINPDIVAADNVTEGSRTPVQTSPISPRLPSTSEIDEDPFFDQIENGEQRLTVDGENSTIITSPSTSTPSSISTISLDTTDFPVHGMVTPRHPCRIETQNMRMLFEVEEPKQGRITVRRRALNGFANTLDVDAMPPGKIFDFYREDGESSLRLDLCGRTRDSICIDLEWVSD